MYIVIRSSGPRNLPLTPEAAAAHNQNHAGLTFLRDPSTTDAKCTKELLYLTYMHQQWHTDASWCLMMHPAWPGCLIWQFGIHDGATPSVHCELVIQRWASGARKKIEQKVAKKEENVGLCHLSTGLQHLAVTQQPSCLKGRLAVASISGVFDSVTLWHPADANVIPEEWKPSAVSAMSSVSMSHYVTTMSLCTLPKSLAVLLPIEVRQCYPALADLAWKPVNELISAWGHIWKLVHAKMLCKLFSWKKNPSILKSLASIQCHTLTFRETGWGTETRRGVPGSTIAHYSPCYIWASWIWIWWLQLVQLPQVNIQLFNSYSRNSAENVLIHINSYSKLGSGLSSVHRALPRCPTGNLEVKVAHKKFWGVDFWISWHFLRNAWRCRWKYRAGAFSVGSCSENSHLHKRNVKNVRLHMLFFHVFVPIKSMKQKWGRMPVHWKCSRSRGLRALRTAGRLFHCCGHSLHLFVCVRVSSCWQHENVTTSNARSALPSQIVSQLQENPMNKSFTKSFKMFTKLRIPRKDHAKN